MKCGGSLRTCSLSVFDAATSSLSARKASAVYHEVATRRVHSGVPCSGRSSPVTYHLSRSVAAGSHAAASDGTEPGNSRSSLFEWEKLASVLWSAWGRCPVWAKFAVCLVCLTVVFTLGWVTADVLSPQSSTTVASVTSSMSASVTGTSTQTWRWLSYQVQKVSSCLPQVHCSRYIPYTLDCEFCSQNILARLLAVALMALPFVVIFGFAYNRTSGVSLGRSLFKAYAVLQRVPGANACNDETLPSVWVMNLTHTVGLFTYALILGLVAEAVQSASHGFKQGNGEVLEVGHTVIMHTNSTTKKVLRQWARGQSERGKKSPIVILSNRKKADLDAMVARIRTQTGLDVQAREGRPESPEDLKLVSAQNASNIIIMDPQYGLDQHERDQNLRPFAAALVSMAGLGPSHAQYILQLPPESTISEEQQKDALRAAIKLYNTPENKNRVVEVNAMESLREARTQCAVCPGIAEFYTNLFCHGDHAEVYCNQFKELEGLTFREARLRFPQSTILGYYRPDTGVHANPPEKDVLKADDWLIGLSGDKKSFAPISETERSFFGLDAAFTPKKKRGKQCKPQAKWKVPMFVPDMRAKSIIVAAFHKPATPTLETLMTTLPRGAEVTIICPDHVSMPKGNFKVKTIKGHPGSDKLLKKAGITHADSLMLCGMQSYDDTEADIQVLTSVAQVADIMVPVKRTKPLHVVADSRGSMNEQFVDRLHALRAASASLESNKMLLTTDILPTERMSAGYLAQTGMQPELAFVLRELFDAKDTRVSIKHPLAYMQKGETIKFEDLAERARMHRETIVGFVNDETSGVTLTQRDTEVRWDDVKSLIVLTG